MSSWKTVLNSMFLHETGDELVAQVTALSASGSVQER
jgi:hypothetical protein